MLLLPDSPIPVIKPKINPTESEKFADGGKYFADMARWIVYNYYNTYAVPSEYNNLPARSIVGEMLENLQYYNGYQPNNVFAFAELTYAQGNVPAVWIKGQKIRQLVDHMKGNVVEMVRPMGKSISSDSISKNSIYKKKDVLDKIASAASINSLLSDIPVKMPFAPAGNIDYTDKTQVEDAKRKVRESFERTATILARNVFYTNNLNDQFIDDAMSAFVYNLSTTHIYEQNGKIVNELIPGYNSIFDFSTNGQFGEGQTFGGFVVPITKEDAINDYPDMPDEWKSEIGNIFNYSQTDFTKWTSFYNAPFTNVQWWYNNQKYFTKATVYWLEKKDMRYNVKETSFGTKKVRYIDDHKSYPIVENGRAVDSKMGYDVKGDSETWAVHKATILGNKYLVDYGYETYQVRPYTSKDKPEIPMFYFCPSKMGGYVRSIVSRLRANQNELDRLAHKIQLLTGQDLGKVFFIRGGKLGEGLDPKNLIDDLKSFKITVIPETGDESSDRMGISDMIHGEDMSNNLYVQNYILLRKEQILEMESITSTPSAALGMQRTGIGKGVQENTISQSSLALMSLYEGLNEFYRRKLQYSANKYKLLLSKKPDSYVMPISLSEVEIIDITKDFRYEDLFVYLSPNDAIDSSNKAIMQQMLQAYSQNSQNPLAAAQAMRNGLKLLRFDSFSEGLEALDEHIDELKADQAKMEKQQMVAQNQTTQQQATTAQILQSQKDIAEMFKILLKANTEKAWDAKIQEIKNTGGDDFKVDDVVIGNAVAEQNEIDPTKQKQPA